MKLLKKIWNRVFIDGLSGMALGLFATLIIGTIMEQIGSFVPGKAGMYITLFAAAAKYMTGAGIGVGVATKFKSAPLVTVSAAVTGMVGAYASKILSGSFLVSTGTLLWAQTGASAGTMVILSGVGEPLGAFIAAYVAIELGTLVSGKTKVDIIVTPLVSILSGSIVGLLIGPSISEFMVWLGSLVNYNVEQNPIVGGIMVSVLMGMILTLPISSAAIGVSLQLSGLAAGAATVGCCANMVGFAVASYRDNKVNGLLAQGLGTSMLQIGNIVKKPVIWIPAILSSAILGPVASAVFKMVSNPVGSGMGSAGFVGQISAYTSMVEGGMNGYLALGLILLMHFVLPAAVTLAISEFMRKKKWIKPGDMKLDV